MEPRTYTINDLFDGNKVYVVPRYQPIVCVEQGRSEGSVVGRCD